MAFIVDVSVWPHFKNFYLFIKYVKLKKKSILKPKSGQKKNICSAFIKLLCVIYGPANIIVVF